VLASEAGEHALGPSKPYAVLKLELHAPCNSAPSELQTVDLHIAALRAELEFFPKRIQEADLSLPALVNAVAAAAKPIPTASPSARNLSWTCSSGKTAPRNTANRAAL